MPEPASDAKRGYSPDCRVDNHKTCQTFGRRCVCPCHGKNGQEPSKGEPVSEQPVAPLRAVEPIAESFACGECERTFPTSQGLALHRTRSHGQRKPTAVKPKPPKVDPIPEREARITIAQAYSEIVVTDIGGAIQIADALLDSFAALGWVITRG